MNVTVVRSPANVCWHVKFGNITLTTENTRQSANRVAGDLNRKYFNAK